MQELMLSKKKIIAPPPATNHDVLLHFNTDFADVGGKPINVAGTPSISSALSYYGGKSGLFKSGDYLWFPTTVNCPGDFTVDFWGYRTGNPVNGYTIPLYDTGTNTQLMLNNPSTAIGAVLKSVQYGSAAGVLSFNTWQHYAYVRAGNKFYCFVNGVRKINVALSVIDLFSFSTIFYPGYGFVGYVDEYAIKKAAKWTDDFTPPIAPYES